MLAVTLVFERSGINGLFAECQTAVLRCDRRNSHLLSATEIIVTYGRRRRNRCWRHAFSRVTGWCWPYGRERGLAVIIVFARLQVVLLTRLHNSRNDATLGVYAPRRAFRTNGFDAALR